MVRNMVLSLIADRCVFRAVAAADSPDNAESRKYREAVAMHRAFIVFLALAICLPSQVGIAGSTSPGYGSTSYLTTTKKPVPKPRAAKKKTNFRAANCDRRTMTWGDLVSCGYDYPSWALGWNSFQRARSKSETR